MGLMKTRFSSLNNECVGRDLMPFGGQIQYMSDLHLDHQYWDQNGQPPVLSAVAPYLVIAGDLGKVDTPIFNKFIQDVHHDFDRVVFVPGNHEFYGLEYHQAMNKMKSMERIFPRLKVLLGSYEHLDYSDLQGDEKNPHDDHAIFNDPYEDNTVVLPLNNGESVRVIGTPLWSEIPNDPAIRNIIEKRVKDYHHIKYWDFLKRNDRLLTVNDTNFFHYADVDWIQEVYWNYLVQEFDDHSRMTNYDKIKSLVVTHHSPLVEECCHPKYLFNSKTGVLDRTKWCNWAFSTRLNWLIHEIQPTAWVFGHTHYPTVFQYKWKCEVSGFDKMTVLASNPITGEGNRGFYHKIDPKFIKVL
jgi:hypothetical protein